MRTPEEIAELTRRGRGAAEALMTTRVRVHRADGPAVTDRTTGVVTQPTRVVYGAEDGGAPAKVQTGPARQAAAGDVAGRFAQLEGHRVDLPVASACAPGDVAEVLSSRMDPDLVGLRFELQQCARGEYRTADRWSAELVTR